MGNDLLVNEQVQYIQTRVGKQYLMDKLRVDLQVLDPLLFKRLISGKENIGLAKYLQNGVHKIIEIIKFLVKKGVSINKAKTQAIKECIFITPPR